MRFTPEGSPSRQREGVTIWPSKYPPANDTITASAITTSMMSQRGERVGLSGGFNICVSTVVQALIFHTIRFGSYPTCLCQVLSERNWIRQKARTPPRGGVLLDDRGKICRGER